MNPAICRAIAASFTAIRSTRLRVAGGIVAAVAVFITACTTEGVMSMRPSVDIGVQTAALPALASPPPEPTPPASVGADQLATVSESMTLDQGATLPPSEGQMDISTSPDTSLQSGNETWEASETNTEIAALPPAEPPQPAAPPPATELPPPSSSALPPARTEASAATTGRGLRRLVPSDPYLVGYPRFDPPPLETPPSVMPASEAACRRELRRLGVVYRDVAPINQGGACRIDYPIKVSALSGGIQMKPAATLNCQMTLAFASWTKSELAPAARFRYLSGIKTIHQGSSYSCRKIRGSHTASEHSKGNALDVMRIELNNGRDVDVRKPGFFAFRQRGFLNNVRADGCQYFTTVLGPGYNWDHRNHFHFDLMQRRNGRRACR